MNAKNYTLLFNHKPKIVIPYTHYKISGKLFFSLILICTTIITGLIFVAIKTISKSNSNAITGAIVSAVVIFSSLILLSQSANAESGNLKIQDLFYKLIYKVNISYDSNNKPFLNKKGKVCFDEVFDFTRWR